jgi:hypothetical protein
MQELSRKNMSPEGTQRPQAYGWGAEEGAHFSGAGVSESEGGEGIQHGKAKGYTHLDFGLSDWDQDSWCDINANLPAKRRPSPS